MSFQVTAVCFSIYAQQNNSGYYIKFLHYRSKIFGPNKLHHRSQQNQYKLPRISQVTIL